MLITNHARERMKKYNLSEKQIIKTIEKPDAIIKTYSERKIYQRAINGYLLRTILKESKGIKTIITCYKARRSRYEIQI